MNLIDVVTSLVLGGACVLFAGCESIRDMDMTIAPSRLMWTKHGETSEFVSQALNECGSNVDSDPKYKDQTLKVRLDGTSICMLRKGFKFVPKPEGYRNLCIRDGVFWNGIACKSARGEYQVPITAE
jgi:hypothetical protein